MAGFAPSASAAATALGAANTITQQVHPGGVKGVKFSLEEVARRVWDARNDPRLTGWAGRVLIAAGKPRGVRRQMQAILNALRKVTMYAPDPSQTERIASPHVTLCLDEHGLCMPMGDCFPEGTLLLRDDFELVRIEEIKVGDRIWGRDKWSTIEGKAFKGTLPLSVLRLNNGSSVALTEGHFVYVAHCPRHMNRVVTGPCHCPENEREIQRIAVKDVQPDQVLIQPKRIPFGPDLIRVPSQLLRVKEVDHGVLERPCWDIQTDDHYVYLPEHDVTVSNCDDLTVAGAGIAKSLDMDVQIIGQAFKGDSGTPSHVLFSVYDPDEKKWLKIDPSHADWPVGNAAPATSEVTLDVAPNATAGLAGSNEPGDFIGVGQLPQVTYVLGKQTVPLSAPVGSVVQEQPGSPYVTTCTKQANGSWTCTNGSTFAPGQLEHLASVTCPAGSTFVSPGLCVPATGLVLASGATLMPDGSYHLPDGGVLLADGTYHSPDGSVVSATGEVTLSTAAEISNALAAAEQAVMHPLDTAAIGMNQIGQGAGSIISSGVSGVASGLTNPVGGSSSLLWLTAIVAAAAGVYVLAPVVQEFRAERNEERALANRR